jgi:hypothetical protein
LDNILKKFFEIGDVDEVMPINKSGKKISRRQAIKLANKILKEAETQRRKA